MNKIGEYNIYYRGSRIRFDLPSEWKVLCIAEPKIVKPLDDVSGALKTILKKPIGTRSLRELAAHAKSVAIICDDQTRPTPAHSLLPTLLDELNELGVPDNRITMVIGRGTHRLPSTMEVENKLGKEALSRARVEVHDPDNTKGLRYLGESSRSTPVYVNKTVADADLKIGIGNVAPHYFAGYGGGPKIVLPGISGRETIVKNHVMIMDPNTIQGRVDGNPVYADMLEIARLARLDVKIDVVLDMENRVTSIVAGEVGSVHRKGIELLDGMYGFRPSGKADVVIASGHPLEENLIQSCKAAMSASLVTKEGGTIVLASACYDGPGHMLAETLEARPEPEEVVRWIAEGKAAPSGGPVASRMRRILKTKRVVVVTDGISEAKLESMGMTYSPTIEAAIKRISQTQMRADTIILPAGSSANPLI
jgi:nickel-dependent lactate racemase